MASVKLAEATTRKTHINLLVQVLSEAALEILRKEQPLPLPIIISGVKKRKSA